MPQSLGPGAVHLPGPPGPGTVHHCPPLSGVGLRSMAERAEELGGTFTAGNAPAGAVVRTVLSRGRAD
ncbi:histidine kinase [Kitasatospora sp. Ki12]|nr:hypothetical protein GCM10018790_50600 [Kitasatospora xanthocidica]